MAYEDITKTGTKGLKGLPGVNSRDPFKEYLNTLRGTTPRQYVSATNPETYEYVGKELAYTDYGNSIYDKDITSISQIRDINEFRAQSQPWYAKLGAGLGKGVALAGTTFLDGTLGFITGAYQAITEGDISKLWDNEISNSLYEFNQKMEEWLPNYRTREEIEGPWYTNLDTMNFWADTVLKNIGFTIGAFYSGGAWNKTLKAVGMLKSSFGAKTVGSVVQAVNEGRVEANHGSKDLLKLESAKLVDAAIKQGNPNAMYLKGLGLSDEEILEQLSEEDENIARLANDIKDRANTMGLTTLIGNTILLSLNNFDTFGKLYARGYENARTIAKGRVTKEAMSEGLDKAAKEIVQEEAGKRISKEGGKYIYNEISKKRAIARGLRHGLVEGNEELAQAFISETAGQIQSPDSPDAYYEALLDPNAEIETKNLLKSVTEGFTNTYGNGDRWEEFAVGAITGIFGVPTFGKVQNSDANTWLGRGKTVGISGGLFGEIGLANKENVEGNEAVNFMNNYTQKVQELVGHFTRSQSFTNAMDGWAEESDAFEYKNAEDNSDFSAISRFAKVGRLGDLKEIVNQDFENIPEEELEKIAEFTSPKDGVGGWRNVDGSLMSDTEEGRAAMREKLINKRNKILSEIDKYEQSVEAVRAIGNNSLTEDQINELAWLNWKVGVFTDRYNSVKEENRNFLQDMLQGIQAFQRGRGVIDEDSEEGKNIIKAIDNTEMFIEALQTSKTPLQLASLIESNPRLMNFIEEIAYPVLEDMVGIDAATFEKSMNDLKDAVRIAKATKSFNQRYKEFRENPIKLIENRATITKKKEKVAQAVNDVNLKDKVSNSSVSDIVLGIEHGDLNTAELDGLFSGEDTNFLNNIVTPEGAATPTGREKVEEAKRIIETSDRMSTAISELEDDSIDPQAIEDALTLVRRSKEVSESEQEMLDTATQAYNDPSLLYNESDPSMQGISQEEIASALDDRLDAAKSVIEQAKAIIAEQNEELSDLPTGKPIAIFKKEDATDETKAAKATIVTSEPTKAESTGHDATPKVVTENERRKKVEAKTAEQQAKIVEQGKVNDFFNEARQEVVPENVKDFDKALSETISNIDMLLSKNTPTKDLGRAIKDTQSYKVLKALVPSIDEFLNTYVTYKTKPTTTPEVEEKTARTPIITNDDVRVQTTAQLGNDSNKGELIPTYQYWKPTLSYLPFGKAHQKGNSTPFYAIARTLKNANGTPMFTEAQLRRIETVGKYLEEHGTFRLIDSGGVKAGDKVSFVIDSALNDAAGEVVILMADSQGRIIGDVMSQNDVSFQRQAYLPAFVEKVMQEYKDAGSPQHFTASLTTVVDKNMVGKIPYLADHEEMNTLNDIHSDENTPVPFLIGVAASSGSNVRVLASAGRTKRQGQSDLERSINPPLVAKAGQPFLLMPTSSAVNHYMPVPIMMDPYSPSTQGTALGQAIHKVLERITTADNSSAIGIIRDLEELISVQEIHINYSGDNVKVTIKPNGAEHQMTIYNGTKNAPNLVEQLELGLQGQPFQVSRKYMNEDYNGQDYNRMIGEVAKTNLPIGATHTVSDWFTLKPIDAAGNITKVKSPRSIGKNPHAAELPVITIMRKGMQLQVNPKTWEVSDGKKTYEGQNADKARALAFGIYTNQNMEQPYNTEWGYYDPIKDEFVEKPNKVLRSLEVTQPIRKEITYTPKGKSIQIYYIEGSHIYNKEGQEVFKEDSVDRNKIFANLAVKEGRAKIVEHNNHKYVVNNRGDIISVTTGKKMQWGPENGDRKAILELASNMNNTKSNQAIDANKMSIKSSPKGTFIESISEKQYVARQVYNSADDTDFTTYYRITAKNDLEKAGIWTSDADDVKKGKIPLDWNPVINKSPLEEEIFEYLTRFPSQESPSLESSEVLEEKAKQAGLLGNSLRKELWKNLTPGQQTTIITKKSPKQKQWMDALEAAWNPITGFDDNKLKGSVDDFLGRKGMYRRTDESGSVWNRERETQWLSKVLPNLSTEEHLTIINGYIKIADSKNPSYAYGKFQEGMITISDIAARGTMYHEAFHAVTHTLLSDEEYQKLFDAASKRWPDVTNPIKLEEELAEDFRRFMQSEEEWYDSLDKKGYGIIRKTLTTLYHKLQNLIKELSGKTPYLNKLYYSINRGKFGRRKVGESDITRFSKESYTSEMQSIKDKAIANGTFMKAPNGNPTNLTERQWLQVRTKAFKEWFGDWEKVAPKNKISSEKAWDNAKQTYIDSNEPYKELANKIFDLCKKIGIGLYSTNELTESVGGDFYLENKSVRISKNYKTILKDTNKTLGQILLHEAIHSITTYAINNPQYLSSKEAKDAVTTINACYKRLKTEDLSVINYYGLKNEKEMIAELANPEFRKLLKKYSLFDKIIDAIKNILNDLFDANFVKKEDSLEKSLLNSLDVLIDSFDKTVFDKSTEATLALRDTFNNHPSIIKLKDFEKYIEPIYDNAEDGDIIEFEVPEYMAYYLQPKDTTKYEVKGVSIKDGTLTVGKFVWQIISSKKSNKEGFRKYQFKVGFLKNLILEQYISNSVSKVVDENGEPKVVYHGSNSKDINIFDNSKAKNKHSGSLLSQYSDRTHFFIDHEEAANETYSTGNGKVYAVFLNIRNPKVIDMQGTRYDGTGFTLKKYSRISKTWKSVEPKDKSRKYFANGNHINMDGHWEYRDPSKYKYELIQVTDPTDVLVEKAILAEENYDGVILNNVVDAQYNQEVVMANDYITFGSPNQIKSATENIGTFDPNNPDIRYKYADEVYALEHEIKSIDADIKSIKDQRRLFAENKNVKWRTINKERYAQASTTGYTSESEAIKNIPNKYRDILIPIGLYDGTNYKYYLHLKSKKKSEEEIKQLKKHQEKLKQRLKYLENHKWNIIAEEALFEQEEGAYYRRVEQHHRDKLLFGNLSQEDKSYLQERGISDIEYKDMTQLEKEVLFKCKY